MRVRHAGDIGSPVANQKSFGDWEIFGSVSNIFDKDPPLAVTGAPFGNGNTYPVVYDALGRRFSINLSASF